MSLSVSGTKLPQFHNQLKERLRKIQLGVHANAKRPSTEEMARIQEAFSQLPSSMRLRGKAAEEAAGQLQVIHNLLKPFEPGA